MRPQSLLIPILGVLIALIVGFVTIVALGGDSDAPGADPTPEVTATAIATEEGGFSPAPELGGNIEAVIPSHATSITQAASVPPDANTIGGICVRADFTGLPDENKLLWFQMAVDGEIVTPELAVFYLETSNIATLCYQADQPLEPGRHNAAVSVSDPDNPGGEPKQVVAWEFDVTS